MNWWRKYYGVNEETHRKVKAVRGLGPIPPQPDTSTLSWPTFSAHM
jgi:hypothetical protein